MADSRPRVARYPGARDHRKRVFERQGGNPICVDWRLGDCDGPIASDHVRSVAANGNPAHTVPRCKHHHALRTKAQQRAAAERRKIDKDVTRTTRRKPPSTTKTRRRATPRTGVKMQMDKQTEQGLAVLGVIGAGVVALKWGDIKTWAGGRMEAARVLAEPLPDGRALLVMLAGVLALLVVLAVARMAAKRVRADRQLAREWLTESLARETNTDPSEIRVRVRQWRKGIPVKGWARYAASTDDAPGSTEREGAEALLRAKCTLDPDTQDVAITWNRPRNWISWEPGGTLEPRAEVEPEEEPEDTTTPDSERLAKVALAVGTHMKPKVLDLDVRATEFDDEGGLAAFEIHYPSTVRDDDDAVRAGITAQVNAKMKGRWKATWDTEENAVLFTLRPKMPGLVDRPLPDLADDWSVLALGIDEHGEVAVWDVTVGPHALFVGSTGSGKSVAIAGVITEACAKGWEVRIVDGKGTTLAGFRDWPGVTHTGLGDPQAMAETMEKIEALMYRRYEQVREHGYEPEDFTPILVVLDEFAQFAKNVAKWWRATGMKEADSNVRDAPAIDAWQAIARLGRECRIHLVVGVQQAASKFFDGTESRDQLPTRVACGPITMEAARMTFGEASVGRDLPKAAKGRATADLGNGPIEIQVYWTPAPRPNGEVREADGAILDPLRTRASEVHRSKPTPTPRAALSTIPTREDPAPFGWVRVDRIQRKDRVRIEVVPGEWDDVEIAEDPEDADYKRPAKVLTWRNPHGALTAGEFANDDELPWAAPLSAPVG